MPNGTASFVAATGTITQPRSVKAFPMRMAVVILPPGGVGQPWWSPMEEVWVKSDTYDTVRGS